MKVLNTLLTSATLPMLLVGCSSDSDTENRAEIDPMIQEIIDNPDQYTAAELQLAYDNKIENSYTGKTSVAKLSDNAAQAAYSTLYESVFFRASSHSKLGSFRTIGYLDGLIEHLITSGINRRECPGGFITLSGEIVEGQESTFKLSYENCTLSKVKNLTGHEAIKVTQGQGSDREYEFVRFTDGLNYEINGEIKTVIGYVQSDYYHGVLGEEVDFNMSYLVDNLTDNSQFKVKADGLWVYTDEPSSDNVESLHEEVNFVDSKFGEVQVERKWGGFTWPSTELKLQFSADKEIVLEDLGCSRCNQLHKLTIDDDGDGIFESGVLLNGLYEFERTNFKELDFTPVDELDIPLEP